MGLFFGKNTNDNWRYRFVWQQCAKLIQVKYHYIGDVRSLKSCKDAIHFGAAALKQVQFCLLSPMKAVCTNRDPWRLRDNGESCICRVYQ